MSIIIVKAMKIISIILGLIIVCLLSFNSHSMDDISGWGKTRWGMTENEVLRILSNSYKIEKKPKKNKIVLSNS